jgi:dihydroorotate dehydrogenase
VVEFMLAGATAVSLGSSIFQDPQRAIEVVEGLPAAIERAGAASARELTGGLKTW